MGVAKLIGTGCVSLAVLIGGGYVANQALSGDAVSPASQVSAAKGLLTVTIKVSGQPQDKKGASWESIAVNRQMTLNIPLTRMDSHDNAALDDGVKPGKADLNSFNGFTAGGTYPPKVKSDQKSPPEENHDEVYQIDDGLAVGVHAQDTDDGAKMTYYTPDGKLDKKQLSNKGQADNGLEYGWEISLGDEPDTKTGQGEINAGADDKGEMPGKSPSKNDASPRYVFWEPDEDGQKGCASGTASINDRVQGVQGKATYSADLVSSKTISEGARGDFMCDTVLTYDTQAKTYHLSLPDMAVSMPLSIQNVKGSFKIDVAKKTNLFDLETPPLIKDISSTNVNAPVSHNLKDKGIAVLPSYSHTHENDGAPLVMDISWEWKPEAAAKPQAAQDKSSPEQHIKGQTDSDPKREDKTSAKNGTVRPPSPETEDDDNTHWIDMLGTRMTF